MPTFTDELDKKLDELWNKYQRKLGSVGVVTALVALLGVGGGGTAVWQNLKIRDAVGDLDRRKEAVLKEIGEGAISPVGSICAWPGDAAQLNDPSWTSHWHVCDGTAVPFSEELWKALRGRYGNPDALRVAQILLPDLQGRFLKGTDRIANGAAPERPGDPGGRADIPDTDTDITPIGAVAFEKDRSRGDGAGYQGEGNQCMLWKTAFVGTPLKKHNHGGENRPPFIAVQWIIRTR